MHATYRSAYNKGRDLPVIHDPLIAFATGRIVAPYTYTDGYTELRHKLPTLTTSYRRLGRHADKHTDGYTDLHHKLPTVTTSYRRLGRHTYG